MNVYDFDKTIYKGDSTRDFYLFLLSSNLSLCRYFPKQIRGFFEYAMRRIDKTEMKSRLFLFFEGVDVLRYVEAFWDKNYKKIYQWYRDQHQGEDIIISASPEFLIRPVCKRLGISHLIASKVDPKTGKFNGRNCYGKEKVLRLKSEYGIEHVDEFYSDSLSDTPMAQIAKNAFLIRKGRIKAWPAKAILSSY